MSYRAFEIMANLAKRSPLRTLHTICETQHQISTRKLEQYLEPIGDELAGFAFNLRQDYDQLRKELAVSQQWEALLAQPEWAAVQVLKNTLADKDSDIDQLHAANHRLDGEVKRLRDALSKYADDNNWCYDTCDVGRDVAKAALSTANGEVTE